jgi:hypothetical protein
MYYATHLFLTDETIKYKQPDDWEVVCKVLRPMGKLLKVLIVLSLHSKTHNTFLSVDTANRWLQCGKSSLSGSKNLKTMMSS